MIKFNRVSSDQKGVAMKQNDKNRIQNYLKETEHINHQTSHKKEHTGIFWIIITVAIVLLLAICLALVLVLIRGMGY